MKTLRSFVLVPWPSWRSAPPRRRSRRSRSTTARRPLGQAPRPHGTGDARAARDRLPGPRDRQAGGGRAGRHRQPAERAVDRSSTICSRRSPGSPARLESAGHDVDEARHEADALREENGALTARVAALEQKLAATAAGRARRRRRPRPRRRPRRRSDAIPPRPGRRPRGLQRRRLRRRRGRLPGRRRRASATRRAAWRRATSSASCMLKRGAFADAAATDLGVVAAMAGRQPGRPTPRSTSPGPWSA